MLTEKSTANRRVGSIFKLMTNWYGANFELKADVSTLGRIGKMNKRYSSYFDVMSKVQLSL